MLVCVWAQGLTSYLHAPKGSLGGPKSLHKMPITCLKLLWVPLTLSTLPGLQAYRPKGWVIVCRGAGRLAEAAGLATCLDFHNGWYSCGPRGSHQSRICICERETPPGAGRSSLSQVTPSCPGDVSVSCASHPGPGDWNREEMRDVPRDLPSTHHRISGVAAALRWRRPLGGDHFKFRGGVLYRKRESGDAWEKTPRPSSMIHPAWHFVWCTLLIS